jgi:hypothetical protein
MALSFSSTPIRLILPCLHGSMSEDLPDGVLPPANRTAQSQHGPRNNLTPGPASPLKLVQDWKASPGEFLKPLTM